MHIQKDKNLRNLPKMNEQITSREVRLIDSNGSSVGIVTLEKALSMAYEQDLDLIEIVPTAAPPVCKIIGFDKYRYEKQKQSRSNVKGKKRVKEIKMGINISEHDLEVKINHANSFLESGHMLRCIVQMRGRELAYKEAGQVLMNKIIEQVSKNGKPQGALSFTSNQIIATIFPSATEGGVKAVTE